MKKNIKIDTKQAKITMINAYKSKLAKTDYIAIKYAEGILSALEYEPIKLERMKWRKAINDLQDSIK